MLCTFATSLHLLEGYRKYWPLCVNRPLLILSYLCERLHILSSSSHIAFIME
ncbi:hypothetical protein C0J52_17318 [Blattella germanica]|nr:hypothetical protein C0J52_17318 [Blattella germanica]